MKTDTIFYELFKEFPNIFFELIGKPDTNPSIYEFKSSEIKQSSFRLDGIFSTLENFPNEPIYFVEVQSYKDKKFYDRFFTSILLYFYQYQLSNPNWYAIVVFDTRQNDVDFPARLNSLRQAHLSCFYLDEMGDNAYESLGLGIIKLIVENKQKAKESVKNLTTKARQEVSDEAIRRRFIELIESILLNKFSNLSREEVDAMLSVNLIKGTRVYQEIKEEVKEEVKQEVKQEIEQKVKQEIEQKVKQEIEQKVKQEIEQKVKQEIEQEVKQEIEQEVKQEIEQKVKTEIVSKLLQRGISVQEVADFLGLDEEVIRKIAEES